MGIDACIYVKTTDGHEPDLCDSIGSCRIDKVTDAIDKVTDAWKPIVPATHRIGNDWHYYGPNYERGPWPQIAAALMALHTCPNVATVWYFGDCDDTAEPFTTEHVLELCAYYMRNGNRPYFEGAARV